MHALEGVCEHHMGGPYICVIHMHILGQLKQITALFYVTRCAKTARMCMKTEAHFSLKFVG